MPGRDMDWQQKGLSLFAIGALAQGPAEGIWSPVVQGGALVLLALLLLMNYKTANADRSTRVESERAEREVRLKHEEQRTERDRLRLDAIQKMHADTIAALERAYKPQRKEPT